MLCLMATLSGHRRLPPGGFSRPLLAGSIGGNGGSGGGFAKPWKAFNHSRGLNACLTQRRWLAMGPPGSGRHGVGTPQDETEAFPSFADYFLDHLGHYALAVCFVGVALLVR